jgi:hypothetical protein
MCQFHYFSTNITRGLDGDGGSPPAATATTATMAMAAMTAAVGRSPSLLSRGREGGPAKTEVKSKQHGDKWTDAHNYNDGEKANADFVHKVGDYYNDYADDDDKDNEDNDNRDDANDDNNDEEDNEDNDDGNDNNDNNNEEDKDDKDDDDEDKNNNDDNNDYAPSPHNTGGLSRGKRHQLGGAHRGAGDGVGARKIGRHWGGLPCLAQARERQRRGPLRPLPEGVVVV